MRPFFRPGTASRRRRGEAELIAVRSRFGELDDRCSPGRVHEVHLELLGAFGCSIGFDFFGRTPIEPPEQESTYVFGRFDRRARDREFGLHLTAERSAGSPTMRIARLIDLYLPEPSRRQGAGTRLMDVMQELWERIGIEEVRATTVGDGQRAFPSWGFEPDPVRPPDSGLLPLRLRLPRKALRVDGSTARRRPGAM